MTEEKIKWGNKDLAIYAIKNLRSVIRFAPLFIAIGNSARNLTPRSISDDLIEAGKIFPTNTIIEGQSNIPQTGGLVLAFSHVAATPEYPGWGNGHDNLLWWVIGMAQALKDRRGASADFKAIVLDTTIPGSIGRTVISNYRSFPINQTNIRESINIIEQAKKATKNGEVVAISPEGESSLGLIRPKRGLARIASAEVPIVPVGFSQEPEHRGKYKYKVIFGKQIMPDIKKLGTKSGDIELVNQVMEEMASLLPLRMRGIYSKK